MASLSQQEVQASEAGYETKEKFLESAPTVKILRIFADDIGKSHFSEVSVGTTLTDFAPPASPLYLSDPVAATKSLFLVFPVGWYGKPHPAPKRQLLVFLSGTVEVTVGDGEIRLLNPGDSCLLEDISGEGHITRNISSEPVVVAVTQY